LVALSGVAGADPHRPGSLLVFPIFDNRPGVATLLTVTNANNGSGGTTVDVEFVYRNWDFCNEFNRTRRLTPNDTITVLTSLDNPSPSHMKGYVYAFAKSTTTGKAIAWDRLIGTTRVFSALNGAYEIEPFVYRSASRIAPGSTTDLDNDGVRDLNGIEYEESPDQLLIPSFFGQIPGGVFEDQLVLINLSGSAQFTAIVDFLVFNDNEEAFSAQYQFKCMNMVNLLSINGVFSNDFLLTTSHDPQEGPAFGHEAGWFKIDGNIAFSSAASIQDPAILAARFEPLANNSNCYGAALPFQLGFQSNGDLLLSGIFGDSTP
jgi:hypothetical protein